MQLQSQSFGNGTVAKCCEGGKACAPDITYANKPPVLLLASLPQKECQEIVVKESQINPKVSNEKPSPPLAENVRNSSFYLNLVHNNRGCIKQ
jgi:hypothetical protein